MIALPPGVRVYLACGVTDSRVRFYMPMTPSSLPLREPNRT
jgi:hypothetical protein